MSIIPPTSSLGALVTSLAERQRIVCFAGIPGVGKSLLVQQLTLRAQGMGRIVHLLQWDVTRAAFETPDILRRYPEIDGLTHEAIRMGVGLWARKAVVSWHQRYAAPEHLLVAEVTLLGNRLLALAEPQDDAAEPLLSSVDTQFVVPVPTRRVREAIEATRERTIVSPQHQRESADAPPNIMRGLWRDLQALAHQIGVAEHPTQSSTPYDPDLYTAVYAHLLRHRWSSIESIDTVLPHAGSVYDVDGIASELAASPEEVEQVMDDVEERLRKKTNRPATSAQS